MSLSLYLHIPFCRQACAYCDFFFVVSLRNVEAFFSALHNEINLYHRCFFSNPSLPISSIYFGGGTPSWVNPRYIYEVLSHIRSLYGDKISPDAEITLEANPDDLNPERLAYYLQAGINRISVGIQSFNKDALTYLKRGHNPVQAKRSLSLLSKNQKEGKLSSWSIDLIYGIPGQTKKIWQEQLEIALEMSPPHLSLYGLTVESGTPLDYQIGKGLISSPQGQDSRDQYLLAASLLCDRGYHHYEVSNYALPGHHSKHNSHYWEHGEYWGGGPGAHSFYGGKHYHNLPKLNTYIGTYAKLKLKDKKYLEFPADLMKIPGIEAVKKEDILTPEQIYNEYLMVGLRKSDGIDLKVMEKLFPLFDRKTFQADILSYQEKGWLRINGDRVWLTEEGWLWADGISRELFLAIPEKNAEKDKETEISPKISQ